LKVEALLLRLLGEPSDEDGSVHSQAERGGDVKKRKEAEE
jgi:hypothetical protein